MPSGPDSTTIRVTRRLVNHIYAQMRPDESVNDTVERLLDLKRPDGRPKKVTAVTTIKISRVVLRKIVRETRKKESRGQTLGRLLGVAHDDGNVMEKPS